VTDPRHFMDLPAASRTAQPFIEKRVDEIIGRFTSSQEAKRFATMIPPLYQPWVQGALTALGGFFTIHRKLLPGGFGGDLLWIGLNRAIDQAAEKFGENLFSGGGDESSLERKREMAEVKLALTKGKDRKLHLERCPQLFAEREAGQGKKGPIPAVKHDWYSVAEAKSFKLIAPDGTVAADYACDSCKEAIAGLAAPVAPTPKVTETSVPKTAAPTTFGGALAAWIAPKPKSPKAAELLAANEDLAEKLDLLIGMLPVERRRGVHGVIADHLNSKAELIALTSTDDPDVFWDRLAYIRDEGGWTKKLGLDRAEEGVKALGSDIDNTFKEWGDILKSKPKGGTP